LPPNSTDPRDRLRSDSASIDVIADEHLCRPLDVARRDVGVDFVERLGEKMGAAVNVADRIDNFARGRLRPQRFGSPIERTAHRGF